LDGFPLQLACKLLFNLKIPMNAVSTEAHPQPDCMKNTMTNTGISRLLSGLFCLGCALSPVHAATLYAIDIDSTRTGASTTNGTITTEAGFTSLDATTHTNGTSPANVTIDGVNFEVWSTDVNESRIRTQGTASNSLTRDFIFEEGTANDAVGIYFGDAGDLQAGTWKVEVWAFDYNVVIGDLEIGLRTKTSKAAAPSSTNILTSSFTPNENDPYTFEFESDGIAAYDFFVREANVANQTRMNAFRLTYIPEPGVPALLSVFLGACLMKRRRMGR